MIRFTIFFSMMIWKVSRIKIFKILKISTIRSSKRKIPIRPVKRNIIISKHSSSKDSFVHRFNPNTKFFINSGIGSDKIISRLETIILTLKVKINNRKGFKEIKIIISLVNMTLLESRFSITIFFIFLTKLFKSRFKF